jgi:stearoyl-CoA desaturase (delta-9 desaturase)
VLGASGGAANLGVVREDRVANHAVDAVSASAPRALEERVNWRSSVPFLALHAIPLLIFVTGVSETAVVLLAATLVGRMFFLTAGYHRYFAHRSYSMGRVAQFVFAFGGLTCAQKGPLWWAAHHRNHHKFADTDRDLHSPKRGFWWSHVGWILCDKYGTAPLDQVTDFARYPELRWLNTHDWIGPWFLGTLCFAIGGWSGLVVGFFASTILLWHSTFLVNSLAHVFGRRRYDTADTSRNSFLIAIVTGGEGWHNNHHRYQSAARQGFRWWQLDTTYYALWLLARLGIVRELRRVPLRVRNESRPPP